MKTREAVLLGVVGFTTFVTFVAVFSAIAAFPTMLVLGALHGSNGLNAVPALGFFQTLGSLFVIGSIGRALGLGPTVSSKS